MLLRTLYLLALSFGLATTAGSAQALTFVDQDFICPVGGEKFKAKVVGSQTSFGQRLDLRPLGALVAPNPLPVCPNGFVMFKERFSLDEIVKLSSVFLTPEYQAARKAHTSYYLAAYLMERNGADAYALGLVYLRAMWQVESDPTPERPIEYRSLALAKLEAFLSDNKERDSRWWTAAILASELERQAGRFDESVKRLDALPVTELKTDAPEVLVLEQIRKHALERNPKPERLVAKQN